MAFDSQQNGDIRATLALSKTEAFTGSRRMLNLPDGRQVSVTIPAGVRDGQELRLEGQGQANPYTGSRGVLILTLAVAPDTRYGSQSFSQVEQEYPTQLSQFPPVPPSAPYPPPPVGGFSSYTPPPPPQAAGPMDPTQMAYDTPAQQEPRTKSVPPPYIPPAMPGQFGQQGPAPMPVQSGQQVPPQSPRRAGMARSTIILLSIIALLIIIGSSVLLYAGVIQPNQMHAQATADAQNTASSIANAHQTATAHVVATQQAIANATRTAIAQQTAQAQATVNAFHNIYVQATSGTPALNDSLSGQSGNNWAVTTITGGSCSFSGGAYHATMTQTNFFTPCLAQNTNFNNFAFQVQMQVVQGSAGGLLFRSDNAPSRFYLFRINPTTGFYDLFAYSPTATNGTNLHHGSASSQLHIGVGQTNLITVIARNNSIFIYFNQQFVINVTDSTYASGEIGVFGEDDGSPTDVAFSNAQVWRL